jgi:hypothetical protein
LVILQLRRRQEGGKVKEARRRQLRRRQGKGGKKEATKKEAR